MDGPALFPIPAAPGHDPLDDMAVSAEMERYFRVRAALAFALRNALSLEQVFVFYGLPCHELEWFAQRHSQEAQAWLIAYLLKIPPEAEAWLIAYSLEKKAAYVRLFLCLGQSLRGVSFFISNGLL